MQKALKTISNRLTAKRQDRRLLGRSFPALQAGIVMVLILVVFSAGGQALAAADEEVAGDGLNVIRLYPTAVVTTSRVSLKDVAQLEGPLADKAGDWSILVAPKPGETRTFCLADMQKYC